jgi:two-component system sensor histidine kinase/response regulator
MNSILVVDDDPFCLDLLQQELTDIGYQVRLADSGEVALGEIASVGIDLVLLDIMMPNMSGIDVLKTVRQTFSPADLPIIMVTAKDHSADIVESLSLGANDYVTKPIDLPVLLARVRTQLHLKHLAEIKDEFLQIAGHDLNAPLMTIVAGASLVNDSIKPGEMMTEDMHQVLSRILYRASDMERIISDFLDLHAIEDGRIRIDTIPTDLNGIASDAVESTRDYASTKGIELSLSLDPHLPLVKADGNRIKQVVHNFLSNAVKFCSTGQEVRLRTRMDNASAILEVSDSGPGLTEQDLGRVFVERGHLSSKPTGGERSFGLGLAISKRLIDLHGGEIGARNNPDGGATFWFGLPVT